MDAALVPWLLLLHEHEGVLDKGLPARANEVGALMFLDIADFTSSSVLLEEDAPKASPVDLDLGDNALLSADSYPKHSTNAQSFSQPSVSDSTLNAESTGMPTEERAQEEDRNQTMEHPSTGEGAFSMLNAYFSEIVARVHRTAGSILKYAGDGVLVAFASCSNDTNEALEIGCARAVECALAIQHELKHFSHNGLELTCKIGIATGTLQFLYVGRENERSELVVTGSPARQIVDLSDSMFPGRTFLSAEAMKTARHVLSVDESGAVTGIVPQESDYMRLESQLARLDVPQGREERISAYVPLPGRQQEDMPVQIRQCTIVFVTMDDPNALQGLLPAEVYQDACEVFLGALGPHTLRQVITDDKGWTFLGIGGMPGEPLPDEANIAVNMLHVAKEATDELTKRGWRCAAGVASGLCICGTIGSDQQSQPCEYSTARREYSATGPCVNMAARLCHEADPNDDTHRVVICSATKTACEHTALFREETFDLKGWESAVHAYYLERLLSPHEPAPHLRSPSCILESDIRQSEKQTIQAAFIAAQTSSQIVILSGGNLTGKSQLLRWARHHAASQLNVVSVEEAAAKGTVFKPLAAIEQVLPDIRKARQSHHDRHLCSNNMPETELSNLAIDTREPMCNVWKILEKLERKRQEGLLPSPSAVTSELTHHSYLDLALHEEAHEALADGTASSARAVARAVVGGLLRCRAIEERSHKQGVLALFVGSAEKSMDALSWEALQAASQHPSGIFLLVSADDRPLTISSVREKAICIELQPFSEFEIELFVRRWLRISSRVQKPLVQFLHSASSGSPEVVEELLELLHSFQIVTVHNQHAVFRTSLLRSKLGRSSSATPSAIAAAQLRIDKLSAAQLYVLKVAAVLGHSFVLEELELALRVEDLAYDLRTRTDVMAALDACQKQGLIERTGGDRSRGTLPAVTSSSSSTESVTNRSMCSTTKCTDIDAECLFQSSGTVKRSLDIERGDSEPARQGYKFSTRLLQSATYLTMPQHNRRALHRRIADVLSTLYGQDDPNALPTIARHLRWAKMEEHAAVLLSHAAFAAFDSNQFYEASMNASFAAPNVSTFEAVALHTLCAESLYRVRDFKRAIAEGELALEYAGAAADIRGNKREKNKGLRTKSDLSMCFLPIEHCIPSLWRGDEVIAHAMLVLSKVRFLAAHSGRSAGEELPRNGIPGTSRLALLANAACEAERALSQPSYVPTSKILRDVKNTQKCNFGCFTPGVESETVIGRSISSNKLMQTAEAFAKLMIGNFKLGVGRLASAHVWLDDAVTLAKPDGELLSIAASTLATCTRHMTSGSNTGLRTLRLIEDDPAEDDPAAMRFFNKGMRSLHLLCIGKPNDAEETVREASETLKRTFVKRPELSVLGGLIQATIKSYVPHEMSSAANIAHRLTSQKQRLDSLSGVSAAIFELFISAVTRLLSIQTASESTEFWLNVDMLSCAKQTLLIAKQVFAAQSFFHPSLFLLDSVCSAHRGSDVKRLNNCFWRMIRRAEKSQINSRGQLRRLEHSWAEAMDSLGHSQLARELWLRCKREMLNDTVSRIEWTLLPHDLQ